MNHFSHLEHNPKINHQAFNQISSRQSSFSPQQIDYTILRRPKMSGNYKQKSIYEDLGNLQQKISQFDESLFQQQQFNGLEQIQSRFQAPITNKQEEYRVDPCRIFVQNIQHLGEQGTRVICNKISRVRDFVFKGDHAYVEYGTAEQAMQARQVLEEFGCRTGPEKRKKIYDQIDLRQFRFYDARILIKNLHETISRQQIKDVFERFGTIYDVFMKSNFAIVEYSKIESAQLALEKMTHTVFKGKRIFITPAEPPKSENKRDEEVTTNKLFVSHLPDKITSNDLVMLFSEFGQILDVTDTIRIKEYAFVTLESVEAANYAKYRLNNTVFRGNRIRVQGTTNGQNENQMIEMNGLEQFQQQSFQNNRQKSFNVDPLKSTWKQPYKENRFNKYQDENDSQFINLVDHHIPNEDPTRVPNQQLFINYAKQRENRYLQQYNGQKLGSQFNQNATNYSEEFISQRVDRTNQYKRKPVSRPTKEGLQSPQPQDMKLSEPQTQNFDNFRNMAYDDEQFEPPFQELQDIEYLGAPQQRDGNRPRLQKNHQYDSQIERKRQSPNKIPHTCPMIQVEGIPKSSNKEEIRRMFSQYGDVIDVIIKNQFTFVEFDDYKSCKLVMQFYKDEENGDLLNIQIVNQKMYNEIQNQMTVPQVPQILISNLPLEIKTEQIQDIFYLFGKIVNIIVPKRGTAYVQYEKIDEAIQAQKFMNGKKIMKRKVHVEGCGQLNKVSRNRSRSRSMEKQKKVITPKKQSEIENIQELEEDPIQCLQKQNQPERQIDSQLQQNSEEYISIIEKNQQIAQQQGECDLNVISDSNTIQKCDISVNINQEKNSISPSQARLQAQTQQ